MGSEMCIRDSIGAWNARHPHGLSARSILDHPLAEEVVVVFRFAKDIPLWLIVPLRDGKVALSYGHVTGSGTLMRTAGEALRMIEMLENDS